MFLFRATFIVAFISVAFVAQVSAVIWPLSRYMLDVIPEGAGDVHINPASAASQGASGSRVGHTDVPEAAGTPAVVEGDGQSDAVESSAVASASTVEPSSPATSSASTFNAASANGASHAALHSTTVFIGAVVAGILLAA